MEALIVLLPLFGALLAMPVGRVAGPRAAELLTIGFVGVAAIYAWWVFVYVLMGHSLQTVELFTWVAVGDFVARWAVRLDALSAIMLVVVTSVSALVHIYSVGYMHEDKSRPRFFAYLSLFTFAMLALVTADNFMQLFFGWEAVGLASYLLIGFYHHKASANNAAMKAFIVNRVGDFGFALGIMAVFYVFGTVDFDAVFSMIAADAPVVPYGTVQGVPVQSLALRFLGYEWHALTLIGILLFVGAMGKSAQFLLHTWLPDAMEGPTPVSALIHAATMVTAGVFLVCRCSVIYEYAPGAAAMVTLVGACTALFAATVAILQDDIKKVIAYSTCSQLGYMFFAAGVGAYGAAMFHLFTHAFFKALLFLGAGSVIHFTHHEQNMKKMGGLRTVQPFTYLMMMIGTLSITGLGIPMMSGLLGVPFGLSGFISKDMIIEMAFYGGTQGKMFGYLAFVIGLVVAMLTAFYSWRLIHLTFHGKFRISKDVLRFPHNVPDWMSAPLIPLAIGGLVAGMCFYDYFVGVKSDQFWGEAIYSKDKGDDHTAHGDDVLHEQHDTHQADVAASVAHGVDGQVRQEADKADGHDTQKDSHHAFPAWVLWAPTIAMLLGFGAATFHYTRGDPLRPGILREGGMIYGFLKNKWYIDTAYHFLFVRFTKWLGRFLWRNGDGKMIDGLGPNGLSGLVNFGARQLVRLQSGYIYHYAFAMLIGIGVLLFLVRTGGG